MPTRIGINGFGRIASCRIWLGWRSLRAAGDVGVAARARLPGRCLADRTIHRYGGRSAAGG